METTTFPATPFNPSHILDAATQLSRTEQIDLLHYLVRSLNRSTKTAHLHFIPNQADENPDDELFTDTEFESLLDWLEKLCHQKTSQLDFSPSKRSTLIELIAETLTQDLPTPNPDIWPEDDIEQFDQFIQEARKL